MRIYGYARVSTREQNEGRQVSAIKDYCNNKGLDLDDRNIIVDKESGKDFNREGYKALTGQLLRAGDTLIVKELDRLGRNKEDIKKELEHLKDAGVIVRILNIPTTLIEIPEGNQWVMDMVNNILIEVMGAVAEEERINIRQRQAEGIADARKEGKHLGRPIMDWSSISDKQRELIKELYPSWKAKGITATKFMEQVDLKRNTFYKIIKEYEGLEG